MSWWIAPLIMGGVKLGIQALTKPKKYKTDLGYLDRYISNLRGDLGEKEIYHTMMRGALRNIGTQEAKTRKMMEYGAGKIGEPVRAQQLISLQQATSKAVTEAGEKAGLVQLQESRRIQSKIEEATMMKERIQEQIRERNRRMEESYRSEMLGTVAETAGSLATTGITAGLEKQRLLAKGIEVPTETGRVNVEGIKTIHQWDKIKGEWVDTGVPSKEPELFKKPIQDIVYYEGKPYDVKLNEKTGEWETLAGEPINISKVTFEKPEKIKKGDIKTAFGPGGEKREYRMIGDVPTWVETGKAIKPEEWAKWDVDRPEKTKIPKSYWTPSYETGMEEEMIRPTEEQIVQGITEYKRTGVTRPIKEKPKKEITSAEQRLLMKGRGKGLIVSQRLNVPELKDNMNATEIRNMIEDFDVISFEEYKKHINNLKNISKIISEEQLPVDFFEGRPTTYSRTKWWLEMSDDLLDYLSSNNLLIGREEAISYNTQLKKRAMEIDQWFEESEQ
ncbi:MAG: hypothetical protein H8D22_10785 [Candidatus Cloacimonetes bacterium]|nr:hypothetical protein [Candidatus Cloacimonadota bacterium]